MVDVGQAAPDFTLRDQDGAEVTLSSFRGERNVVLVFYPLAFTGVCQGELCAVRDDLSRFQNDDVQVLSVSVDSVPTHKKWAEEQGYTFPLLADFWPHGAVAQSYGVFNDEAGVANRGTFLVDVDGVIRFSEVNEIGAGRDPQRWLAAIAALSAPPVA